MIGKAHIILAACALALALRRLPCLDLFRLIPAERVPHVARATRQEASLENLADRRVQEEQDHQPPEPPRRADREEGRHDRRTEQEEMGPLVGVLRSAFDLDTRPVEGEQMHEQQRRKRRPPEPPRPSGPG